MLLALLLAVLRVVLRVVLHVWLRFCRCSRCAIGIHACYLLG
jgi:hypothetical protein